MTGYQVSDFLMSSLVAFLVAYFVRGSVLRMTLCAAIALALETLIAQILVVHRINVWALSYLLTSLGALAVGVAVAFFIRRR